jgi:hypothetical protein
MNKKVVWKYALAPDSKLSMPVGAQVLSVHEQSEVICLWALVDPNAPKEIRCFAVFGTGHAIPAVPMRFHGTAHLQSGALVAHVFELLKTDLNTETH